MSRGYIKIFTNSILGGWHPSQLKTGLGGSEECVVYLASELAKHGYYVEVFTSLNSSDVVEYEGVLYRCRSEIYDQPDCDVLISFKDLDVHKYGDLKANKRIHWSSEVERYDPVVSKLDAFIFLTHFHRSRMPWITQNLAHVIPHGLDFDSLQSDRQTEKDLLLYSSSMDRGLFELLRDWGNIKSHLPSARLAVTYGMHILEQIAKRNESTAKYIDTLHKLLEQPDIIYTGQVSQEDIAHLYHRAEYWVLPLQIPESELFCLNATKSHFCGAFPVVNKIGALKETVGSYIDYKGFIHGDLEVTICDPFKPESWQDVVEKYWLELF